MQYLAVEWAKLLPKDLPSHPITLLIELRAYIQDFAQKRCQNFLEFIHKGSGWIGHLNQNELDRRLKRGEVRVLFDGLDEVFDPQQRANVITQIHSFTQTYDKVKVIVTSRVIGYKPQKLKDAEFYHFMWQDLEPEQLEDGKVNLWAVILPIPPLDTARESISPNQDHLKSPGIYIFGFISFLLPLFPILYE